MARCNDSVVHQVLAHGAIIARRCSLGLHVLARGAYLAIRRAPNLRAEAAQGATRARESGGLVAIRARVAVQAARRVGRGAIPVIGRGMVTTKSEGANISLSYQKSILFYAGNARTFRGCTPRTYLPIRRSLLDNNFARELCLSR